MNVSSPVHIPDFPPGSPSAHFALSDKISRALRAAANLT
jgi:hypothetical protein